MPRLIRRRKSAGPLLDRMPRIILAALVFGASAVTPVAIAQTEDKSKPRTTQAKPTPNKPAAKPAQARPTQAKPAQTRTTPASASPAIAPLSAASGYLTANERTLAQSAIRAAEEGAFDRARLTAGQLRDQSLTVYIDWLRLQRQGSGARFETLTDFIQRHPDLPAQETLQRRAEELMDRADDAALLAFFANRRPVSGDGMIRLGDIMMRNGRAGDGQALVRDGWIRGNLSPQIEANATQRYARILTPQDHFARASRLVWDRDTASAQRLLPLLSPRHRAIIEARLALAGNARNGEEIIARLPAEALRDDGLAYERLRWLREAGREGEGESILLSFRPDEGVGYQKASDMWWSERVTRARRALAEGRHQDAYRIAANHGLLDSKNLSEAEWLAGWIALRFRNDPRAARDHFEKLYTSVRFPVSLARGAYWLGRAHEAMGETDTAIQRYEDAAQHSSSFYGQLALVKLNRTGPLPLPPDPAPDAGARAAFERREAVRISRILADTGETARLRSFIMRLQDHAQTPQEHALVAQLANDMGRLDLAVAATKRSTQDGVLMVRASFPIIEAFKNRTDVESALLLALSRQESEFNIAAVSRVGARGLMQLMPATARQTAGRMGLPYDEARLLIDPDYNAQLGSFYLRQLLNMWDGHYVLALASYNAGEGRVQRWIRDFGDPRSGQVDVVDWIELIPFTETRNYVQRILEGVQIYRHILNPQATQTLALAQDLRGRRTP